MIKVQSFINTLQQQKPLTEWPPTTSTRGLRSFAELPKLSLAETEALINSDIPEKQLQGMCLWYKNGEYKRIRDFFKADPGRLGDPGKLLLVLAYLRLFAEKPNRLSKYVIPLIKDLLNQEPAEFTQLYNWFQDYLQERQMAPQFYEQSEDCKPD